MFCRISGNFRNCWEDEQHFNCMTSHISAGPFISRESDVYRRPNLDLFDQRLKTELTAFIVFNTPFSVLCLYERFMKHQFPDDTIGGNHMIFFRVQRFKL